MIAAIIWSPIIAKFPSIYQAVASMICYIAPPITAVFVVGIFWRRATARAATITLWSGFALGLVVFALDFFKEHTGWSVLFMHASAMLCGMSIVTIIALSLAGKDDNTDENRALVWEHPLAALKVRGAPGVLNYKFLSVLALLVASAIYYAFRQPSPERVEAWEKANPEAAARIAAHRAPAPPEVAEESDAAGEETN